jgi:signal transduction histidine kinase
MSGAEVVSKESMPIEHRVDSELESLQQQVEQMQRLCAIGELTSATTHEFNNLLMTILNYAKLGLRQQDQATRDKAFNKILDAGNRAAKLTSSILGMAKNRSGELEPTNLAEVIQDSLMLLERELRRYRISIETQIEDCPLAMASGNDIQRLLLNLITNARQAIGEAGQIRIRLYHEPESQSVVIMVRDTGFGIPAEALPKIFDPFYSTKKRADETGKGGTGLGLSVCKKIVEQHRGKIRVESSPGKGTAFFIRIPAQPT